MEAHGDRLCPLPLGERVEAVDDDDEVSLILHLGCDVEETEIQPLPLVNHHPLEKETRRVFLTRNVRPCFRSLLENLPRDGRRGLKRKLFHRGKDGPSSSKSIVLKTFHRRKKAHTAPPPPEKEKDRNENPSQPSSSRALAAVIPSPCSSRLPTSGFVYRKAWVIDLPVLEEPRSLDLLARLGLDKFAREPVPDLEKLLCDEFLSTFDAKAASGSVRGKVVAVDAASVAEATGLPLGDAEITLGAPSKAQELALKKVMIDAREKRTRGYSVQHLAFGDHVQEMQAIATMLMAKLECKNDSFHLLSAEMVLALDKSYRLGVKMRWSEFLARMIVRAAAATANTKKKLAFEYGEWLSKIIRMRLGKSHGIEMLSSVCEEQRRTSEEQRGTSEEDQGLETLKADENGDEQALEVKENGDNRNEELESLGAHCQEQAMEIEVQVPQEDVNAREELTMVTEELDAGNQGAEKQRASSSGHSVEKQDAGVQTETRAQDLVTEQRLEIRRLRAELRETRRRDTEARSVISSMKTAYVKFKQELAELRAKQLPEPTNE